MPEFETPMEDFPEGITRCVVCNEPLSTDEVIAGEEECGACQESRR